MLVSCRISVSLARDDMARYGTHDMSVACGLQVFYAPAEGTGDSACRSYPGHIHAQPPTFRVEKLRVKNAYGLQFVHDWWRD
jgi:hypothetical protein